MSKGARLKIHCGIGHSVTFVGYRCELSGSHAYALTGLTRLERSSARRSWQRRRLVYDAFVDHSTKIPRAMILTFFLEKFVILYVALVVPDAPLGYRSHRFASLSCGRLGVLVTSAALKFTQDPRYLH
jgi:hypothetical protein